MRPRSSTLLFSAWFVLVGAQGLADGLRPTHCLPPIFEAGQRLHDLGTANEVSPLWLQLLLRQHEICWRAPDHQNELRIVFAGNSAIYGFPLLVEETVGSLLNQHFADEQIPAHLFNLGFVMTYQLKDALIIHESTKYRPDMIVYAVTLADFMHVLPVDVLDHFFETNDRELTALAQERPAGLTEPAEMILSLLNRRQTKYIRGLPINEIGGLARAVIRLHAKAIRRWFFPDYRDSWIGTEAGPQSRYDCANTKQDLSAHYENWQEWNILAYVQHVRELSGVEVVIVNWPVAHHPVEDCYSVRYTNAALEHYNDWMREETRARGLSYLDLHDLLPIEDFVDSLHVNPVGHRKVAQQMAPVLDTLIAGMLQKRRVLSAGPRLDAERN